MAITSELAQDFLAWNRFRQLLWDQFFKVVAFTVLPFDNFCCGVSSIGTTFSQEGVILYKMAGKSNIIIWMVSIASILRFIGSLVVLFGLNLELCRNTTCHTSLTPVKGGLGHKRIVWFNLSSRLFLGYFSDSTFPLIGNIKNLLLNNISRLWGHALVHKFVFDLGHESSKHFIALRNLLLMLGRDLINPLINIWYIRLVHVH